MSAPAKILVRTAEGRDAEVVVELIRQLAAYEKLEAHCVATEDQVRKTLLGKDRCAETLLVFSGEVAAGFAVYFFNYSTFLGKPGLYLEDLFVKPEFRGQGLGKALFAELIKVAAARGCGRMEWSVLDWNEPAMAFYERIGALPQREWIRYRLDEQQISRLAVDGNFG